MEKTKIILDVDTGSDDAVAITLAVLSKDIEVIGITTVGGNVELKNTTDNTLRVLDCCNRSDIPVYAGSALPLVSTLSPFTIQSKELPRVEGRKNQETAVHTDHLPLPPTSLKEQPQRAVPWLIETLLKMEDRSVTFVGVGPATNLALALRADERIAMKIKRLVLMGGTHDIYAPTQGAEFNVWCDPEAMEILLQSGIDLTMVSLDATASAELTEEQSQMIRAIGSAPSIFVADLIDHRLKAARAIGPLKGASVGAALHDALAVCAVNHPEVLTVVDDTSCHVDLGHGYAYGETVLGRNYEEGHIMPVNCHFARKADGQYFFEWMYHTLMQAK